MNNDFLASLKEEPEDKKPEPSGSTIGLFVPTLPASRDYDSQDYIDEMLSNIGNAKKLKKIKEKYRSQGVDVDNIGFT